MKIKCLVVDDEPLARAGIAEYVGKTGFTELAGVCKNAVEANSFLKESKIDLVFLDIQMPELSGLEWLKSLHEKPLVVLTTAFRQYAVDGFELDVLDYIVKPVSFERFFKACNKALKKLQHSEPIFNRYDENNNSEEKFFFIKDNNKIIKIQFQDILYIKGMKDYVMIHTFSKNYLALISLKKVEQKLPATNFMRIHRSYIVAINKITAIEGTQLKIGNDMIPVSRELQEPVFSVVVNNRLWKREN